MLQAFLMTCIMLLGLSPVGATESESTPKQQREQQASEGKGISVEDAGRGLKSAAQNVEKEIPKIGPAIGDLFKKITGKGSEKEPEQASEKQKPK